MLDAYTVRKAIPRILIAVIGINVSIYLCLAAVDIVNIVGGGIARLLTEPFVSSGVTAFNIPFDVKTSVVAGVGVVVGGAAMKAALSSFIFSAGAGGFSFVGGALLSFFFLLLPIILLLLGILCVVVLRQALLFFLIVTSPVAIACFVLPGTEKYFQKWLDLFIKTLLVYPIIAVMFALSDVFASIIFGTSTGVLDIAKIITGLVVIFAPLFLIPFAFRLAGGAIAALSKVAGGAGTRISEMGPIKGRREHYGQMTKDKMLKSRADLYRKNANIAENSSGLRKFAAKRRMGGLGGYRNDLYLREAEMTKRHAEQQELQKNFGDDTDIRAYGIDVESARRNMGESIANGSVKQDYDASKRETTLTSADGRMKRVLDAQGNVKSETFRSLGGSWQTETAVRQSERRFGKGNMMQLQNTLNYEMTKAIEEGQQSELIDQYADLTQSWGMSDAQAQGTWIGPAFNNQQEDLMYKQMKFEGGKAKVDYEKFTREVYEKKGPQMLAYLKGKNVHELRKGHAKAIDDLNTARASGDADKQLQAETQLKMHEAIMDTLAARGGAAAVGVPGAAAPAAPSAASGPAGATVPTGGSASGEYGYTTGSGHTTDELKQYFSEVQATARERSSTPTGPISNPRRDPTASPVATDSRAAEVNPKRNPPRL